MQNKPNFLDAQMNLTSLITVDYENIANWKLGKNKANTNPLKANLLHPQMNVSSALTKYYENDRLCRRAENKPKQTRRQINDYTVLSPMPRCGGADLNEDSVVNFLDFALFDGCCAEIITE